MFWFFIVVFFCTFAKLVNFIHFYCVSFFCISIYHQFCFLFIRKCCASAQHNFLLDQSCLSVCCFNNSHLSWLTRQSDTTVTKTPSISPQNIMLAAFQPKVILQKLSMEVILQKLSMLAPVLPAVGVSKGCIQTVKSATTISTSNLRWVMGLYWLNMGWDGILTTNHLTLHSRNAKRPAPDEEEVYVSEEEEHISEQDQYKSINLYHRCCSACLDRVRLSQVNMHHGQNPLLIPLLFKFRQMTARRRIKGKVRKLIHLAFNCTACMLPFKSLGQ